MVREEEHMTTDYIRQVNLKEKLTEAYRSVERAISNIDDANTLLHKDKHEDREYTLSLMSSLNENSRSISNALNRLRK